MGRYVKKWCPHCNYVIQNFQLDNTYGMVDVGEPFMICPNCKGIIIKKNIKEANMLKGFDYFRIWFWNVMSGLLVAFFVSLIITLIVGNLITKDTAVVTTIFFVTFVPVFIMFMYRCKNVLDNQIEESNKRLKSTEYRKIIEDTFINPTYPEINIDKENEEFIPQTKITEQKQIKEREKTEIEETMDDGLIPKK